MKRDDPEQLKAEIVRAMNRLRVSGIGLSALSLFAFLFSRGDPGWPLTYLSFWSAVIFTIGATLLFCGTHLAGKLAVYGNMKPPPVTLDQPDS